jgi:hypothetical protein
MEDNVDVVLTNDTVSEIIVEAGEALIEGVESSVKDSILLLRNTNSCNWVRNMHIPVKVFVPFKTLKMIDYKSYGNLSTRDTLRKAFFQLDIRDGSGSINLCIDVDSTFLKIHEGVTDVSLSGAADFNYIYNNSIGPVNTRMLDANSVVVHHKGPGDCYAKAKNSLDVSIDYSGNVYYFGNPLYIKTILNGSGRLIHAGP